MNVLSRPQAAGSEAGAGSPPRAWQTEDAARGCLGRAVDALVALQHPQGWWKGELETNVTIDAEDLLLREFLGIRTAEQTASSARWIRSRQREDGTWANFHGGPPDLSTTVEAYVALRLAGDPVDAAHMRSAARFIHSCGGVERTRVFTRIWLALFDLWSWDELPTLPPELIFLPSFVPLNIYDFGCWARQTVVALTVVSAHRPAHTIGFGIDELRSGLAAAAPEPLSSWAGRFQALDRVLKAYERHQVKFVRRAALSRAERWIVRRQEADGSWGGIQPPWVYSLIALSLQGYALEHPVMRAGIEGLDGFTIEDDAGRRIEACQSPVWDTALAVTALADGGFAPGDPVLRSAARYLLAEEISVKGDWSVRRPDLRPAGWAFEFANDYYPDIDDSAEVVIALGRTDEPAGAAVDRAVIWIEGMQCRDGGWGAFDVDNTRTLCRELPFCDFGELIDPPSADVTAHVVEMLAKLGRSEDAVDRGVQWLLRSQEEDGSWFGRWGANHVYGTGAVVPALIAAGLEIDDPAVRQAVSWLEGHQNSDGGWGEDLRSYRDYSQRGCGPSTASQTAWALLALLAAGERSEATHNGVAYLIATQREDGSWDEPFFTGTGFPGDFYINYHLYRLVFPVTALGRFVNGEAHG
ncbi:MAG: squalene--hopene cyclase [Acidimicrobiales bacterium]|jgi:squalene-hopene/tetraprenyl-beta-curcumene cyclase